MIHDVTYRPVTPEDLPAIKALHDRVFGPGRYARTAHRVREGRRDITHSPFCRVAVKEGAIVAALRMSEVAIGGARRALLLGPLAVDQSYAGQGLGRTLIATSIEAAKSDGISLILLVGDEPYYGRFGFKPVPPGRISMPGPVNPQRLLALEFEAGALARMNGLVTAV